MAESNGPGGVCEWKRSPDGQLPNECPIPDGCAEKLRERFGPVVPSVGIPQAYQDGFNKDGSSFSKEPVERSSASDYILRITDGGSGPARMCASFPNLPYWRCQDFHIDREGDSGLSSGVDTDGSKSISIPKSDLNVDVTSPGKFWYSSGYGRY